jgi:hypothetical protein
VTSEYSISVTATTPEDAADIAKRRARDDGYVVVTVKRVVRGILPGRWSVQLAVRKP